MGALFFILAWLAALTPCANAQPVAPDPDLNNPDKSSWELFVVVNGPVTGIKNVTFETWASNDDTFQTNPKFPGTIAPPPCTAQKAPAITTPAANPKILHALALEAFGPQGSKRLSAPVDVEDQPSEEVRHNEQTFNFIVCNKLYTKAGLRAAFALGQPISFPVDSIDVKADWKPLGSRNRAEYYVNTASDGKLYALVSLHVVSKRLPNWTWATFEHTDNPGRCDFIGCHDHFGATAQDVEAHPESGGHYDQCVKTAALKKMLSDAGLPSFWENYCLKGSQTDFTTATGIPTRLGNSITEDGFILTSSCITCHSLSSINAEGHANNGAGFISSSDPAVCPPADGACSPNGSPNPDWFWTNAGQPDQALLALQTDFVFSISLQAIDP
jgi:hypothetical protein